MIQQRTMFLQPKQKKFSYSQLYEMLSMSPAKRDTITPDMTIKQIREIKRQPEPDLPPNMETIPIPLPDEKPTGQTEERFYKNQTMSILRRESNNRTIYRMHRIRRSRMKIQAFTKITTPTRKILAYVLCYVESGCYWISNRSKRTETKLVCIIGPIQKAVVH